MLYGVGPPPTLQLAQQSKLALYNHTTIPFTTSYLKFEFRLVDSLSNWRLLKMKGWILEEKWGDCCLLYTDEHNEHRMHLQSQ